jgi:hypothetical protein
MPLKGDKGMAVETEFGAAGAFEREAAISMIVRHLLGHGRAYHAPCLQRYQLAPGQANRRGVRRGKPIGGLARPMLLGARGGFTSH